MLANQGTTVVRYELLVSVSYRSGINEYGNIIFFSSANISNEKTGEEREL
jgi:hypothetical protein